MSLSTASWNADSSAGATSPTERPPAPPLDSADEPDETKPDDTGGIRPMGKGDKRTRRGKIFKGSHGKKRPKHTVPKKPVAETQAPA
ncbi:MAG: hypothetical protein NVSMB9_23320 [Isosphaeraceae bacterium]